MSRYVVQNIENIEEDEGVGAKVRRSIGTIGSELRNFDPFLLLDEFSVKAPAGFPAHPHRGFETVTYLLTGYVRHEDFSGNQGVIGPGDLQWMSAGRGIVHCEMPHGEEMCHGLQLWVNLSKANKMMPPEYQDIKKESVPSGSKDGVTVNVVAGESMGVMSPIYTRTPTIYLDFKLEPNASFTQNVPSDWNAFIFILKGEGEFGSGERKEKSTAHHTLILSQGESVRFSNPSDTLLHLVLIAGQPLNEPIARRGPFVMNTEEEIEATEIDFETCKNGFENYANWHLK